MCIRLSQFSNCIVFILVQSDYETEHMLSVPYPILLFCHHVNCYVLNLLLVFDISDTMRDAGHMEQVLAHQLFVVEMNTQICFLVDEEFAVLLTIASVLALCWRICIYVLSIQE